MAETLPPPLVENTLIFFHFLTPPQVPMDQYNGLKYAWTVTLQVPG